MTARFGFGSRTGAAWETHDIDDLSLELFIDPTNLVPRFTSIALAPSSRIVMRGTAPPGGNLGIESSSNFLAWSWRARTVPNVNGIWQFVDTASAPDRVYRLLGVPQMPPGLIDWWRADGNYAAAFGGNHGSSTNLGFITGRSGQALNFERTNQVMNLNATAIPAPWTAGFWVKRHNAFGQSATILADATSALKLEQTGTSRLVGFSAFGSADYSFNYSVPTNVWTHLACVANSGGTILYVNGVATANNPATVSLPRAIMGARTTGADQVHAMIDGVVLFNRALGPAEIQQVINATRGP